MLRVIDKRLDNSVNSSSDTRVTGSMRTILRDFRLDSHSLVFPNSHSLRLCQSIPLPNPAPAPYLLHNHFHLPSNSNPTLNQNNIVTYITLAPNYSREKFERKELETISDQAGKYQSTNHRVLDIYHSISG